MTDRPRLIVNADDFGLAREVNDAVAAAHEAGTVSSATLLAAAPGTEHAVRMAERLPRLGIGLHLDLTLGRPICPPATLPTLVDGAGRFHGQAALAIRALSGRISRDDVARELSAQLDRLGALGVFPTHVDGHQHVQVLPGVLPAVLGIARARGLPVRVPFVHHVLRLRSLLPRVLLDVLCRRAVRAGAPFVADGFASVFDDTEPPGPRTYARLLARARCQVLELMVHPIRPSAALAALQPGIYATALAEGRALLDPATREVFEAGSSGLLTYREAQVLRQGGLARGESRR